MAISKLLCGFVLFSCTLMCQAASLDALAERYVKLTLAVGKHDANYIDAYYGPAEWQVKTSQALPELEHQVSELVQQLALLQPESDQLQRREFLQIQSKAMLAFIRIKQGKTVSFAEEARLLYDVEIPKVDIAGLDAALTELAALLPGKGDLNQRMQEFNQQFVIPKDKLDQVFKAAISESRRRTRQYIPLSANENFSIEYVTDKVWSGYNWYQGNNFSLIQLNTDFPIYINRAIDLASHEGYPGHHVFNAQMEQHQVKTRQWLEYSVYPLFSPMSLLAEGSANYGIAVAYEPAERTRFEQTTLFPLAGLDPATAPKYYQVQAVLKKLSYADMFIAQQLLDGAINEQQAIKKLMKYTLVSAAKAKQRIGFIRANRAYVINYTLGQDLVQAYVEARSQGQVDQKWAVFAELLAQPKTASMMLQQPATTAQ